MAGRRQKGADRPRASGRSRTVRTAPSASLSPEQAALWRLQKQAGNTATNLTVQRAGPLDELKTRGRALLSGRSAGEVLASDLISAASTGRSKLSGASTIAEALTAGPGVEGFRPRALRYVDGAHDLLDGVLDAVEPLERLLNVAEHARAIARVADAIAALPSPEEVAEDREAAGEAYDRLFRELGALGGRLPASVAGPLAPYIALVEEAGRSGMFARVAREWGGIYERRNTSRGRGMGVAMDELERQQREAREHRRRR